MILDTLLDRRSPETRDFASWLYSRPEDLPSSSITEPPVADIAIWGLTDDEWIDAVRAAKIALKFQEASEHAPVLVLSNEPVESDGGRAQIWGGTSLRPSFLEDFLGRSLYQSDEQVINDIVQLLPSQWSIVIESRGVRRPDQQLGNE